MSYEAALKRLGLSHLKDKPEEALKAAQKIIDKYQPHNLPMVSCPSIPRKEEGVLAPDEKLNDNQDENLERSDPDAGSKTESPSDWKKRLIQKALSNPQK